MTSAALANLSDINTIFVVRADGTKSNPYTIGLTTAARYVSSIYPNIIDLNALTGISISASGRGFTQSSQIYLDDKPIPTTYVSTTRLSAQFTLPAGAKVGEYHYWTVRDGNYTSNTFGLAYTDSLVVRSVSPAFASASGGAVAVTVTLSLSLTKGSVELFGKSTPVLQTNRGVITLDEELLKKQKPGLYTGSIKDANGKVITTFGFPISK